MGQDETYEATVRSWDFPFYSNTVPPIRYKVYTVGLPDGRTYRIQETKLLDLDVDDRVLVIFPKGNISQAYLSEVKTSQSSTVPNSDYLVIVKMIT